MQAESYDRLVGAVQLAHEAVEVVGGVAQVVQDEYTRAPYAALRTVKPLTPIVDTVQAVHELIALVSYRSVPFYSRVAGSLLTVAISALQAQSDARSDRLSAD